LAAIGLLAAGLAACEQPAAPTPQVRSVRAVAVERRVISEPVVLIGQIKARDEISLAFRVDGKLMERTVAPGDRINVGRLIARLDSQNEQNALQGGEADIAGRRPKSSRRGKPTCSNVTSPAAPSTTKRCSNCRPRRRSSTPRRHATAPTRTGSSSPSWKPRSPASSPPREPNRENSSAPAR